MRHPTTKTWIFSILTACSMVGCAGSSDAPAESEAEDLTLAGIAPSYRGTIAGHDVMVRLARKDNALSGRYFYVDVPTTGDELELAGSIEGHRLTMRETDLGTQTGAFSGVVREDKITGTWSTPDGSRREHFELSAIQPGAPVAVKRFVIDKANAKNPPAEDAKFVCTVHAEYLDVFGLADAAAESSLNEALADAKPIEKNGAGLCTRYETVSQKQDVVLNEKGLIVIEETGTFYAAGGAHPYDWLKPFNFSVKTGTALKLSDVIKLAELPRLMWRWRAKLYERTDLPASAKSILDDTLRSGIHSLDDALFELRNDGLVLSLFDKLPVAAQSLDAKGTLLPWSEVDDLVIPESEAAALVK